MKKLAYLVLLMSWLVPGGVFAQPEEALPITPGETITGEITDAATPIRYTFEGKVGDILELSLTSTDFDPKLSLEDGVGVEVVMNDDYQGGLNAFINYTLSYDDTYTIVVSSVDGTGTYELSFKNASLQPISFGETVEGTLTPEISRATYAFDVEQDQTLIISLESSDFNPYLELSEAGQGYPFSSDDDSGIGNNAFIGPMTIIYDTTLIITVTTYETIQEPADFTLTLDTPTLEAIAYGDTVGGSMTDATPMAFYRFKGTTGDKISARVESEADLTLTLRDPSGYEIAYSDDDGSGKNPELSDYTLNSDGNYTLIVRGFSTADMGDFELSLTMTPPLSLDEGSQTVILSEKQSTDYMTFSGEANTVVTLNLQLAGATTSTYLNVYQNGTSLAYADSYLYEDLSDFELEVQIPENGLVLVSFTDYSYNLVTVQASLQP